MSSLQKIVCGKNNSSTWSAVDTVSTIAIISDCNTSNVPCFGFVTSAGAVRQSEIAFNAFTVQNEFPTKMAIISYK